MRYMLLIYDAEIPVGILTEAQRGQMFQEYMAFTEGIKKSGHHVVGRPAPADRHGDDGPGPQRQDRHDRRPFAETREQLGGYYIIEAYNLDEATGIAARIPSARIGSIEVRPIMEMGG